MNMPLGDFQDVDDWSEGGEIGNSGFLPQLNAKYTDEDDRDDEKPATHSDFYQATRQLWLHNEQVLSITRIPESTTGTPELASARKLDKQEISEIIQSYKQLAGIVFGVNGHRVKTFFPTTKRSFGLLICSNCFAGISFIRKCDPASTETERSILRTPDCSGVTPSVVIPTYFDGQCTFVEHANALKEFKDVRVSCSLHTGKPVTNVARTFSQHLKRVMSRQNVNSGRPFSYWNFKE